MKKQSKILPWILGTVMVLLILCVWIYLYFAYIHTPLIFYSRATYYFPWTQYYGVEEYYTNDKYLEFEYGSVLKDLVETVGIEKDGYPVVFYYNDTWPSDNPIAGDGQLDTYCVEFQLGEKAFEEYSAKYPPEFPNNPYYTWAGYRSYDFGYDESINGTRALALNPEKKTVRVIVLTAASFDDTFITITPAEYVDNRTRINFFS